MLKTLFSLSDLSIKSRASAYHYRTLVGRLNLWGFFFFLLSIGILYLINFPVTELGRALVLNDNATINGIVDSTRNAEIAIFLISAIVAVYLFFLSIGAMIMRLHDFGLSGWFVLPVIILPPLVDTFLIEIMGIVGYGWVGFFITIFMLYKQADFAKNAYGYQEEPECLSSKILYLVSMLPVTFLLIDLVFSVFIF